jgi:NDP-sugar pyrophosphorylase family protein
MKHFSLSTFRRLAFILIFTTISFLSFGQTDSVEFDLGDAIGKLFNTQIEMEVDESLYPQKMGNFYMSESPVGILIAMSVPQDYLEAKEDMFDGEGKSEINKIKDKGSFMNNGLEISYAKGITKKDGKKLWMELYTIQLADGNSLFVIGSCEIKAKDVFSASFLNAAKTAKIVATEE